MRGREIPARPRELTHGSPGRGHKEDLFLPPARAPKRRPPRAQGAATSPNASSPAEQELTFSLYLAFSRQLSAFSSCSAVRRSSQRRSSCFTGQRAKTTI